MTIKLTDAAKYYKELPHQLAAWNYLQEQLTKEQLDEFADLYRSAVDPKSVYQNTWNGIRQAASDAGAKFPEVVAAQWALESGWGKHIPASGTHNYFGLKGKGGTVVDTQEYINGQWMTIKDGFINFPDIYSCVLYLVNRWYKDFNGYQGVNRASNRNECAKLLVKKGYATDPYYADKLMQIMDRECKANPPGGKVLNVPYFYQLDNQSGYGYRECFSSSCAMIAAYYGLVNTDDEYNKIRAKFGDSTEATAQIKALQHLGLTAWFGTKGDTKLLENQIKECHPIAVGWLHYGSANAPKGGGHWTCCIGFDKDHIIMNDPYGEADLVNGGYVSTEAKRGVKVKYNRKNWLRRWEVEGKSTGWYLAVKQ